MSDHFEIPPALEARYGPLRQLSSGMQSRVFATEDGQAVIKIYRQRRGDHRREAANMVLAGLGDRVIEISEETGDEALVQRRFAGEVVRAETLGAALPGLRDFFARLHAVGRGQVDLAAVWRRQRRFREQLAPYPLADLFEAVEGPLSRGELEQPASFCHLDPWQGNILIGEAGGVLVIDWNKAGWDDPLRDIALLKTGTLDLLSSQASLEAALSFLPSGAPGEQRRLRAYLAHTYLHDFSWFLSNQPGEFEAQYAFKLPRARDALARLPA